MKRAIVGLMLSASMLGGAQLPPGPPPAPEPMPDLRLLDFILSVFPFQEPVESEPWQGLVPGLNDLSADYSQDLSTLVGVDLSQDLSIDLSVNLAQDLSTNLGVNYGQDLSMNLGVNLSQNLATPTWRW